MLWPRHLILNFPANMMLKFLQPPPCTCQRPVSFTTCLSAVSFLSSCLNCWETQTLGLELNLPRGSRCLTGAETAILGPFLPSPAPQTHSWAGQGGVSRAATIQSTYITQGGVAETCAKEDGLQVSSSNDERGKQGKKRGCDRAPPRPRKAFGKMNHGI